MFFYKFLQACRFGEVVTEKIHLYNRKEASVLLQNNLKSLLICHRQLNRNFVLNFTKTFAPTYDINKKSFQIHLFRSWYELFIWKHISNFTVLVS